MRRLLPLAVLLLTFPAVASAAPPEGFFHSWRLSPIAQKMGDEQAMVYCARNAGEWTNFLTDYPNLDPKISVGLTYFETPEMFLAPQICRTLENWKRGRSVGRRTLAFAILVFSHEIQHLRGERDELDAQCRAARTLASTMRVHFGVKNAAKRRALVASVRSESTGCYH